MMFAHVGPVPVDELAPAFGGGSAALVLARRVTTAATDWRIHADPRAGVAFWLPPSASCSMNCATFSGVSRSIHVRLDDAAEAALEVVRADGINDSEAVRTALGEAAAHRRRRAAIAEEVRRLAHDPDDVEEMRVIREQLADLAPSTAG